MKNTPKKPVLEKIAREGFIFSSHLFEWDIYSKGNKRIAYDPRTDKIKTRYKERERRR